VDAPILYEITLGIGDELVHQHTKTDGKHLGDNLGNAMNEVYGPKIIDVLHTLLRQ
jgi:hypothetical protein